MAADYPYAQWFDAVGTCRGCKKPATGSLRSYYGNSTLGYFCERCAEKEIKAAHRKGQFKPDAALATENRRDG